MFQLFNGLVLCAISIGIAVRRHRKIHVPIMLTCFVLDLGLVLYLELSRGAIDIAAQHVSESLMQIHLLFAILTIAGYCMAIYTGRKILNGAPLFKIHHLNALIFLTARIGVFVTSFWVKS